MVEIRAPKYYKRVLVAGGNFLYVVTDVIDTTMHLGVSHRTKYISTRTQLSMRLSYAHPAGSETPQH